MIQRLLSQIHNNRIYLSLVQEQQQQQSQQDEDRNLPIFDIEDRNSFVRGYILTLTAPNGCLLLCWLNEENPCYQGVHIFSSISPHL